MNLNEICELPGRSGGHEEKAWPGSSREEQEYMDCNATAEKYSTMKKLPLIIGAAAIITIAGSAFAIRFTTGAENLTADPRTDSAAVRSEGAPGAQAASKAGCGSSGCGTSAAGSGCCGSGASPTQAQIERIRTYLYEFYAKELTDPSIEVDVQDLGCHQEATITRAGSVVKRLSINGRRITEIG